MFISVLSLLIGVVGPIVLVVWAVRRAGDRSRGTDGRSVRRFFLYVLLYGLLIVAATGLIDLAGVVFAPPLLAGDERDVLARALTFTVLGLPMFVLTALWTRRHLRGDADEAESFGWAAYLTVASLTALGGAMGALHGVVSSALSGDGLDGTGLAGFVVWAALWWAHRVVTERLLAPQRRQALLLLGSLVGLVTSVTGLVMLLGASVSTLVLDTSGVLATSGDRALAEAAATVVVGAPVWFVYWLRGLARGGRTPLWLAYVLPVGVGGSLVLAVVGLSVTLYQVLVWLVGEPAWSSAADHFRGTPVAGACVVVGAVSWWYHRRVLAHATAGRSEVTRVYEYLMAGVALVAAAAGVSLVLIAVVEAAVPPAAVERGTSVVNAVLAAVTLLVVGGPLWWLFWSRIGRVTRAEGGGAELASPTRRIYLFVLFGLGGVVAVVAVLVAAFLGIQGALRDGFVPEVLRAVRVPVAILLATGATAGYHWVVYRHDRQVLPAAPPRPAARYVLLIGALDPAVRQEVAHRTGARVDLWERADGLAQPWSVEDVVAAVNAEAGHALTIVAGPAGLETITLGQR
jgi:hypothetical protein